MTSSEQQSGKDNLAILLQLEAEARRAESQKALQFLIVNETRRLISYRQAFLFNAHSRRVEAASSLAVIDRNAPSINWLEAIAKRLLDSEKINATRKLDAESLEPAEADRFTAFSLPYVIFCPMKLADGLLVGGLWLARETPWQDHEILLVERLGETYAHAWVALTGKPSFSRLPVQRKWIISAIAAGLVAVSLLPVRMSTIAPAEVVPLNPVVVSAPMDGVIKELPTPPNTPVSAGDVVFRYEDTNHRAAFQIASKSLDVATARLRKATQGAFQDEAFKGQVALLTAELSLKEAELEYARTLLEQVEVRAAIDGLLVYSDESDWQGKPVAVGEKIMEIVDPGQVQFRILLPVNDAIVLNENAEVEVFLHADPLTSIRAVATGASFTAELTPANVLAYRVDAKIVDQDSNARIGSQGSARVYGERVSLFFYVFRRPISALRQFLGL